MPAICGRIGESDSPTQSVWVGVDRLIGKREASGDIHMTWIMEVGSNSLTINLMKHSFRVVTSRPCFRCVGILLDGIINWTAGTVAVTWIQFAAKF